MDNDVYQNEHNQIDQKYNNKIKSMKFLVQCNCIFILKYYTVKRHPKNETVSVLFV